MTNDVRNTQSDVVIVGGGIIGLFCAYYLTKEGRQVTILEKGDIKDACSYGNCGLVSPSHALPLNSPELLLKSIGWLFQKDSPFYIRPQADLSFISWLLGFALNSFNKKQLERSMHGRNNLLISSRHLYQQVFEELPLACDWSPTGIHFVFSSAQAFEAYKAKDTKLAEIGLAAAPITGADLYHMEPALSTKAYGSWYYKIDASVNPGELVKGLKQVLTAANVQIVERAEVQGFFTEGKKIKSIETNRGVFSAENVIMAAGAWSPTLQKQLRLKIPIVPGKGYSITMKSPKISPKCPIIFEERKVVATPWKSTYRLGGTMEFSGYNTHINRVRIDNLKKVAAEYLKTPYTDQDVEEWVGWRPMTTDGMPIIGKSPDHDNLHLACGHNMLGLSMAPATGKMIAEQLTGQATHIDQTYYSLDRF